MIWQIHNLFKEFHALFVQEVDDSHLEEVDTALELEDLMGELDFLRVGFDEVTQEVLFVFLWNSFVFFSGFPSIIEKLL